jgi:CelD/BcsL family acetyltransferase involved in cellulose biosynthesis
VGTRLVGYGEPLVGTAWDGTDLIGIAPMISSNASFAKVPVRRADCAGTTVAAGELLIRDNMPGIVGRFVGSLIDKGNFDVICLNGIDINSEIFRRLKDHTERYGVKLGIIDYHSYAIADLRGGYQEYSKSKSRNFRRQTSRIEKKIAAVGKLKMERILSTKGQYKTSDIIERMFSIAKSSWRIREAGPGGLYAYQPLFRDVISRFGEQGAIDFSVLTIGSEDAAFTLSIVERGIYYQISIAFDDRFNAYSPGSYLLQEVFKVLPDSGIHLVVSHGDYIYKERWATEIVPQKTICIFGRSIRAALSHAMKFKVQNFLKRFA